MPSKRCDGHTHAFIKRGEMPLDIARQKLHQLPSMQNSILKSLDNTFVVMHVCMLCDTIKIEYQCR